MEFSTLVSKLEKLQLIRKFSQREHFRRYIFCGDEEDTYLFRGEEELEERQVEMYKWNERKREVEEEG